MALTKTAQFILHYIILFNTQQQPYSCIVPDLHFKKRKLRLGKIKLA